MSRRFKDMNLHEEESEWDYHHRQIREVDLPRPRPGGRRAETKYNDLKAKVDRIGQSLAQLLKVVGQQGHWDKDIESRLIRDPAKGKAPLEESIGELHSRCLEY